MNPQLSRKRDSGSRNSPKSKRSSITSSPARPSSAKKKKPRKGEAEQEAPLWSLKDPGILDERTVKGVLQYKLNWAGIDPATNKPYQPSWHNADCPTPDVVAQWEEEKRKRARRQNTSEDHASSPIDSAPDSSPIRPSAKRKRQSSSTNETSHAGGPRRKIARVGEIGIGAQSGTSEASASPSQQKEIKDSYEDESNEISLNRGGAPHVEISLNEDFDRTKYSRFPSSSQPTQASSSQQIRTCPEYVTPSRPRFSSSVAPEENIAGGVIPDSQDLPGPSAYEHTGTPSSISGRTARNNTESNTEEGTQEIVTVRPNVRTYTSRIQRASQSSEQQSQFDSEPGGYDKRLRDSDTPSSDFDIPSAQPRPSLDPSISLATQRSSPRRPTSSYSLSRARPSLSQNQSSQPLRPHTTFFELSQTPSSQIQPYRRAKARSVPASSPQFHTQVPLSTGEPSRAASRIDESEVQSSNLLHTSDPRPESQSQSSPGHVVSRLPSFTQTTQGTASTFTQDWKAVEARYPEASTSKGSQKSTNQNGKPSNLGVFKNPKASSNSQADSGTQKSNQRSQGESSHLPSPPFEEVVSSVEAAGSITQASHQGTPSPLPLQQDQLHIESSQATSAHPPDSTMAEAVVENPQQTNHESESRERVTLEAMPSRLDLVQGERETSTMSPPPLPEHVVRNQQAMAANDMAPPRTEFDARPLFQVLPALPFGHVPVGPGPDGFVVDQIFAHQSGYSTASDGSVEVPEEYIVPLPMVSQTRDIYKSVVRNHRHQIACFINDEVFDTSLVNDIDSMVEELQMLCDHQTLHEDDSATQAFEDHTVQAKWAQNISTKCIFLAEFLQAMRDTERTIVILVRPGKMTDILEAILSYHDLVYSRADQVGTFGDPSETSMRITLLPTNMRIETKNPEDLIDLIIAFDSTYTSLPNIDHLKRNPEYPYKRVPVISLVIANSIEHVERSIPESLSVDSMQRKIQTVRYLQQIHDTDVVGMLPEGDFGGPPEAARRVVAFLQNGSDPRAWNLPFLPALEDLEPEETQMEYPPESSNPPQPYAIKRPLDNEDTDSPKRQRLTPSPGEPSAFDQTQMDNHLPLNLTDPDPSIVPLTQANLQTVPALSIVSIPRGDGYAASKAETHILLDRLQALELRLQKKEESEAQLLEENTKLEARCKDYESSIAQINPKYQEALNERGSFEHEATMAQVREGKALKALENKTAAYDKLKSEKSAGDEALAAAKKTLLESTIPGIAETQALEDEIQTLKEKNARLEKTIEREANTLSYIQSSYRDASSAFESAKDDIATLESKLEIANRTANDNIVKIHEINRGNEISELRGVIKGLRNEKAEMERTEERLRESVANAVRRTMRGQSVPHSPRMGTMSPRAQAGVNVQRFQSNSNVGSRGTSPAPGEQSDQGNVMGPRAWSGRSAFGEVLYGSAPPSGQGGNGNGGGERGPLGGPSRFGNHLQ